jgi:uncharacterized protein
MDAIQVEDNEKSFAELYERIEKTIDLLKKATREDFEGKESMEIELMSYKFTGLTALQKFSLPK